MSPALGGSVVFIVGVTRYSSHTRCDLPLGRFDYGLFVPPKLLPEKRPRKHLSQVLHGLPLASLEGSPAIREALEDEARKCCLTLNVCYRFNSYPQLAQAVQAMNVAAIMPTLATLSLPSGSYQRIRSTEYIC